MKYGTVYLNSRSAPGGTDWHQGNIQIVASGVFVNQSHYYPNSQVQRVSYR